MATYDFGPDASYSGGATAAIVGGDPSSRVLLVCEHASRRIPPELDGFDVAAEVLESHAAWDPGAFEVARQLAENWEAPLVYSNVSRLIYDCNRPPEAADAIPERIENFKIPANRGLSEAERNIRVERYYRPFERLLDSVFAENPVLDCLVTVHSFTPVFNGKRRQVQLGILHDRDGRLADAVLALAGGYTNLDVQRNAPYGPADGVTHTLKRHGVARGLLNVMIEIRSDLLATAKQRLEMSEVLDGLVRSAMSKCGIEPVSAGP